MSQSTNTPEYTGSIDASTDTKSEFSAEAEFETAMGYITILGEHLVKQDVFDRVFDQFLAIHPKLEPNDVYEPAELCGLKLWASLSVDEQRQATLCLRHVAIQFHVPWFMTTCRCCGKVYFSTSRH